MLAALNNFTRWTLGLPAVIHLALAAPAIVLLALALTENLGVEPLDELIDQSGKIGVILLAVSLSITPLAKLRPKLELARLLKRKARAVGLAVSAYASIHLTLHILYEGGFAWLADSAGKPFIYLGLAAWVILLVLAVTSWNKLKRVIGGKRWKMLHRSAYIVGILAIFHYGMAGKGHWPEAITYASIVLGLRGGAFAKQKLQS